MQVEHLHLRQADAKASACFDNIFSLTNPSAATRQGGEE